MQDTDIFISKVRLMQSKKHAFKTLCGLLPDSRPSPFPIYLPREQNCNHKPPCIPVQMLKMPFNHSFPATSSDIGIFTQSSLHLPIILSWIFFL